MVKTVLRLGSCFLFLLLLIGLALPAYAATNVPCNTSTLISDIASASSGDTLDLTPGCTYSLSSVVTDAGLPDIGITLTIDGNGDTINRDIGGSDLRLIDVSSSGNLTLNDLTLSYGSPASGDNGGGIDNSGTVTATNCDFSNNVAGSGGGLYNKVGSTLTVTSSTFSDNSATADQGGGIYNKGTLTVINSTFSNNTAPEGGGGGFRNEGMATVTNSTFSGNSVRFSGGAIQNFDTLTVINSTFSGNSAGYGGGIIADPSGTTTVTNSTFSGNTATSGGTGIDGVAALNNSILDDTTSSSSDCDFVTASSISHTLIQDGSCGVGTGPTYTNGNLSGDPLLGTLTGSPAYFPLQSDSPVIDAGDNSLAVDQNNQPLTTDQRGVGYARIFNGTVDMGSYEFGSTPPTPTPPATSGSQPSAPVSALCADVNSLADGAITVSGGVQNVLLNGVYGNTYCHLIAQHGTYLTSPAEIGVQSVISLGVVDAVDVFGQLPGGESVVRFVAPVTICLQGSGDVLFLSAADASRTPQHLAATVSGGYQCVSVPNSGTVVLVGSASNIPAAPTAAPSDPAPTTLADCKLTTTHSPLNLRAEPNTSASVIAQLPYQLTLTATAHQSGWYQVIYGSGQGWVSDQFVSTAGTCG